MIVKYEKEDEDDIDEDFVKKYVLLNVLLTLFIFKNEIFYFVQMNKINPGIDVTKRPSVEEINQVYSMFEMDYKILFKLGLWLSESYENSIYPWVYDMYHMAILISS
jgi:hypothetical protein